MNQTLKTVLFYAGIALVIMVLVAIGTYFSLNAINQKAYTASLKTNLTKYDLFSKNQPEKWNGFGAFAADRLHLYYTYKDWNPETRRKKLRKLRAFVGHNHEEVKQILSTTFPPMEVNVHRGPFIGDNRYALFIHTSFCEFYGLLHLYSGNHRKVLRALSWLHRAAQARYKKPGLATQTDATGITGSMFRIVREMLRTNHANRQLLRKTKSFFSGKLNVRSKLIDAPSSSSIYTPFQTVSGFIDTTPLLNAIELGPFFGVYWYYTIALNQKVDHDLLSIALDLKMHLLKHGRLPSSISKHIDRTDPYTGTPYKFTRRNGKLILYSIGSDLVDNKGKKDPKNDDHRDPRVVIPLEK